MNLITYLVESLRASAKVNSTLMVVPAAILWTDAERNWESALPKLRQRMPELLTLGEYLPSARQGPSIWLKCAVARALDTGLLDGAVPVIYLPGASRSDLRAIEDCPRELQPLAELQFRGAFWSQVNAKDWTVNALLTAKSGGVGCEVAQDKGTQDALKRALVAGVLLEHSLEDLQTRSINASWLDSLLARNPTRDILVWLNDPAAAQAQWASSRWEIFCSRCGKDFGFDPATDGEMTAAEKLAGRLSAWSSVWELYQESFSSFPKVAELLTKLQPPKPHGLFDDVNDLAGYPRANDEGEAALRYKLHACGAMAPAQACVTILEAETEHAARRDWLWARMGQAPLAQALQYLAELAKAAQQIPSGSTVEKMAAKYIETGWWVDAAAIRSLAAVQTKADVAAVGAAVRAVYLPWLEDTAIQFQELVKAQGGLNPSAPKPPVDADGVCTVFVDGLRYDVAMMLKERLEGIGQASVSSAWTSIPSVTASGKAWTSPVAHAVAGKSDNQEFQPSVAVDGKPLSSYNLRKLLADHGWQVLNKHETGDASGCAWVECGDLDHYGHEHGLRLARDLDGQLRQIIERLAELKEAGWNKFHIVTDHGWLLMPGGLPKTELAKSEAQTRWGRCAVLKDTAHGTPLTFNWDWCADVQIAMAPGISSFIAGAEYAHGGLTLQECLVPVIDVVAAQSAKLSKNVAITKVSWKGLLCKIEVAPVVTGLSVDIRTKAALADSSVVAKIKALEGGKASMAIEDDAHQGSAAFVVVLDAAGAVVQKVSTTVGE